MLDRKSNGAPLLDPNPVGEAEFLQNLLGAPQRTSEGEVLAIALQDGGVTAQPLRYLDVPSLVAFRTRGLGDSSGKWRACSARLSPKDPSRQHG